MFRNWAYRTLGASQVFSVRHAAARILGLPVVLGEVDIPVNEFLDLKREDVIVIDKSIASTVEMKIGSEAVIEGNIGMHNDRLAMKVIGVRRLKGDAEKEETAHG